MENLLPQHKVWPILRELALIREDPTQGEAELRKLLRPHTEAGFGPEEAPGVEMRQRLDVALGSLTRLEIAYQLELDAPRLPEAETNKVLKVLFGSEAFLRYVNYYLFFGIRFLAGRLAPETDWLKLPSALLGEQRFVRDSNQRPFELAMPPEIDYSPFSRLGKSRPKETKQQVQQQFELLVTNALSVDPAQNWGAEDPIVQALDFLDGAPAAYGREPGGTAKYQAEKTCFELWLCGLRPDLGERERKRFETLAFGLFLWAISRSELYHSLPSVSLLYSRSSMRGGKRPLGGWSVDNPAAARLGLADVYWISRLFRAEVSAEAIVKYSRRNWLELLRQNAALLSERQGGTSSDTNVRQIQEALSKAEEVLRSVFDYTCDLVQNALEVTSKKEQQAFEHRWFDSPIPSTVGWRDAFDEELEEIERERCAREFQPPPDLAPNPKRAANSGWSRRIRTGEHPSNLIGLAFSGGGIRSATFNLGLLQGLQKLDLLRKIDYLSTVSGGGFIGAWLIGNVCRTRHWLGAQMNWDQSIAHLRSYSNYLSPRTGVVSADTWTMWASWLRNALLIQLTGAAWLLTLLLAALLVEGFFDRATTWTHVTQYGLPVAGLIAGLCLIILSLTVVYNLWHNRAASSSEYGGTTLRTTRWLQAVAVVPAWFAAFLLSNVFWADAGAGSLLTEKLKRPNTVYAISYSGILGAGIQLPFWWLLLSLFFVGLYLVSLATLSRFRRDRRKPKTTQQPKRRWLIWHSFWISLFSVLVFYLEICGIVRIFMAWGADSRFDWYAYVLGPPLVLAAFTLSVVIFIGLSGRNSEEAIREWWTRFGTWLGIYGVGYLLLTGFAVFGPLWTLHLFHASDPKHPALINSIKWASVISWVGTVVSGLLAGKSSKTNGESRTSPWLEVLANVAGLLFIVGAIFVAATVLYVLLFNIALNAPASDFWSYWASLNAIRQAGLDLSKFHLGWMWAAFVVALFCGYLFSRYFEINIFGLNQFYRNRLVRCYLGATRWAPGYRQPQPFTKFDASDDMKLGAVLEPSDKGSAEMQFRGPFPLYNCTLNLAGSADLALHTRHSASFTLTPKRCGADREKIGYAPTRLDGTGFADGVMLGQAVAISGAAASPNMGYNTSPLVAFLLTMFNVRLGWWFPNPSRKLWKHPGLNFSFKYLIMELFGIADETSAYVNVSDGGHFENLGIYELVRRGCKVIIAGDAECDESLQFGSLGNVIRLCETDFGAKIVLDVGSIRRQQNGYSVAHCSVGTITYSNGSIGYLIYLKASVSGDEEVGIAQYRSIHPSFPHETTADQFFSEDQFESYRQLGLHVVQHSFRSAQGADHPVEIAEKLADVLTPTGSSETFLKHIKTLYDLWERFRQDVKLRGFLDELEGIAPLRCGLDPLSRDEILIGLEIIQLMENVFLDLRLDDFWDHPDNRGWAVLFMRWAGSRKFRKIWEKWRSTFGIRFEHFCDARLGLPRGKHSVRV